MSPDLSPVNNNTLDPLLSELAHKHALALNDLDQQQFVEVMRQMILSGDLRKNVVITREYGGSPTRSSITYIPYQGVELLRSENREMRRQLAEIRKVVNA